MQEKWKSAACRMPLDHRQHLGSGGILLPETPIMPFPAVCHIRTIASVYCSSGERTMEVKLAPKLEHRWLHISVSSNPGARHLVFNMPHLFTRAANKKLTFIPVSQPWLGDVADEMEGDKGKIISRSHSFLHTVMANYGLKCTRATVYISCFCSPSCFAENLVVSVSCCQSSPGRGKTESAAQVWRYI